LLRQKGLLAVGIDLKFGVDPAVSRLNCSDRFSFLDFSTALSVFTDHWQQAYTLRQMIIYHNTVRESRVNGINLFPFIGLNVRIGGECRFV
jgi:hypothetical protein